MEWSTESIEKVISFVQERPFLFDVSSAELAWTWKFDARNLRKKLVQVSWLCVTTIRVGSRLQQLRKLALRSCTAVVRTLYTPPHDIDTGLTLLKTDTERNDKTETETGASLPFSCLHSSL